MDHSMRGYLNRRTDRELECALRFCIEQDNEIYNDTIQIIYEIMAQRLLEKESGKAEKPLSHTD